MLTSPGVVILLLVSRFSEITPQEQTAIYKPYQQNTRYINNCTLINSSAPKIVGAYLSGEDKSMSVLAL